MSEIIFHGNNLKYVSSPAGIACFPPKWTTSARQALGFAYESAKNYNSSMVVFAFPDFPKDCFEKLDLNVSTLEDVEWYEVLKQIDLSQRRKIEVYNELNLESFVNKYFSKGDFEHLLAMKYAPKVLSQATLKKHENYGKLA